MNLGGKLLNSILRVIATGRVPRKGALFRVVPLSNTTLSLRLSPSNTELKCFRLPISSLQSSTFLVLDIQDNQPLWKQWVKVLFCRENEDTLVGWLPYHEFNRFILPEWEKQWEDEETQ